MPIFEYTCKKCKTQFEELVFGEGEPVLCPKCGSAKTQKLMSCCRSKVSGGGGGDDAPVAQAAPARSGGGCAGCSGGSCSSCG